MNENDKRMEDFFKRSMDQFDDTPSEDVWSQLSDRLEAEESFVSKAYRIFRTYLPIALLVLALGSVCGYSFNTIGELKNQNNTLIGENKTLNSTLSHLTEENKSLIEKNNALNNLKTQLENENISAKKEIKESQLALLSAINKNKSISNNLTAANKLNTEYLNKLNACGKEIEFLNGSFALNSEEKINRNTMDFNLLTTLNSNGINYKKENDLTEKWKKFSLIQAEKEEEEIEIFTKFKYRYGFTARAYNAFVSSGHPYHLSHSYGLIHELSLNKNWSLTNSIEYNDQEYSVVSNMEFLPASILDKFPDNPGAYANVRSVKSRAKYIDTQLGIKYRWMNKKENANYFINPSVVWQLYFPQEFTYDIIQAQDLLVERRSYTAYFGSINLQLGIEKSLSDKLDFQLAIFAEKSLIELGHDNQNMNLVGVRSSILFGK